ncbi:MAG: hypothetical protein KGH78_00310, partial [Candidatus Micrarchaeota archaeon]|nr:hypothetical protein [Candidatus Micrarchaeota archaeon]
PFVFAKGCIEGGMKVRGNIEIEQKAYDASLIANYAKELKEKDQKAYQRQFGSYIKENVQIEEMPKLFAEAKQKIMKK